MRHTPHSGILAGLAVSAALAACGGDRTPPPLQPLAANATTAPGVPAPGAGDGRAIPTANPFAVAAPTDPAPLPSALSPPSALDPATRLELRAERNVAGYALRLWQRAEAGDFNESQDRVVTLAAPGQPAILIPWATDIDPLTGTDITGEGHPDVVVRTYTGGAHCCFQTYVYDLGETPSPVLRTPASSCDGHFEDLDGNGRPEFVTCDASLAYAYCSFAETPMPQVILAYEPGRGFVPAGPRFAGHYAALIEAHEQALAAPAADPGSPASSPAPAGDRSGAGNPPSRCAVLALVLDQLYAGQTEAAWAAFAEHYAELDAPAFRAEIEDHLRASPLYVAPGEDGAPVLSGEAPAVLEGADGGA